MPMQLGGGTAGGGLIDLPIYDLTINVIGHKLLFFQQLDGIAARQVSNMDWKML